MVHLGHYTGPLLYLWSLIGADLYLVSHLLQMHQVAHSSGGPGVYMLLTFEYMILLVSVVTALLQCGIQIYDSFYAGQRWVQKPMALFCVLCVSDFIHFGVLLNFFIFLTM